MKWTSDDVKMIEKFIQIRNKGFYCDGGQLTQVYNRVLEKNVPSTNCGSCMRQRISELENALNQFKKQIEIENKAISSSPESKTSDELMKERMAKVRAARKPKNEVLSSNVNESKNDASEDTQQTK